MADMTFVERIARLEADLAAAERLLEEAAEYIRAAMPIDMREWLTAYDATKGDHHGR